MEATGAAGPDNNQRLQTISLLVLATIALWGLGLLGTMVGVDFDFDAFPTATTAQLPEAERESARARVAHAQASNRRQIPHFERAARVQ